MEYEVFIVAKPCPFCGEVHEVVVEEEQYDKYMSGGYLIQDCFPNLSADKREIIKTGICPKCWDEMCSIV